MARTVTQIQEEIKAAIQSREELSGLTSTSKSAIWLVMTYVIAYTVYSLEILFDIHKTETDSAISLLKPHTQRWYREKAKLFQFGYPLVADSDVYDNSALTEQQIEASKVIKYCAVNEATNESRLIVKIATESGGVLLPIGAPELNSFKSYINEIKDAGLTITVTNYLPDILDLDMIIYYDPLVIATDGSNLLDGLKPVEISIKSFLKELPFNGVLKLSALVEELQKIEGVEIPHIVNAFSSWINPVINDYGNPVKIDVYKIPESGYFTVNDFTKIKYKSYE